MDYEIQFITLALLKVPSFSNSYMICKLLTRKFGGVDSRDVIKILKAENFIMVIDNNTAVDKFTLTETGEDFLKKNKSYFTPILREKYKEELEFLDKILDKV